MNSKRNGAVVLAAAGVLLTGAWMIRPAAAPPLYDGIGLPPEPYHYVSPPANRRSSNTPPHGQSAAISVQNGQAQALDVQTPERPFQARVILDPTALQLPGGSTHITVSIEPVLPPTSRPDAPLAGNVYRVAAVEAAGRAVPSKHTPIGSVYLRVPVPGMTASLEEYTAGHWIRLAGSHIPGTYAYTAAIPSLGLFALVNGAGSPRAATKPASSDRTALLVGGGVALLLIAGLALWYLSRRRRTVSAPTPVAPRNRPKPTSRKRRR